MAFEVNEMRAELLFDGARSSHYKVLIQNPVDGAADLKSAFTIKAASQPPSIINPIEVPYFGRRFKVAGDRMFPEWTVTVINDEDFLVKNAMQRWMNSINSHRANLREFASASPLLYTSQAQIVLYSKTGVPIKEYNFVNLWPSTINEIPMSWEAENQIQEFDVTFQYDYWTDEGTATGGPTTT